MPIREDITNGAATDYKFLVVQLQGDERMKAILKQCEEHRWDWRPTAAAFNDVGRARDFAANMCQMRITTEVLTAETPSRERERICERLARGDLEVVACVECSINAAAIRTVVVCDEHTSPARVQELLRCASQLHKAKPYFRVVIPCQAPDDVAPILRMIADDPYIRRSARAMLDGRAFVDSRISIAHELQSRDPDDGVEVSETFTKRLAEILGRRRRTKPQALSPGCE